MFVHWCTQKLYGEFFFTDGDVTAVYIIAQTLNKFNFHYFIISHFYPILFDIIILKTLNEIVYFLYYAVILTHMTTIVLLCHYPEDDCIIGRNMLVNIINKWRYIITLKCICWFFIYFTNLINVRNMVHIKINSPLIFYADNGGSGDRKDSCITKSYKPSHSLSLTSTYLY